MNNNNEEIVISEEVFNQDLDDAGWEPEVVEDSDEEMAQLFDY